jgi:hypothetical protein
MDTDATKAPRPDAAWKEVLQDAMDEIVNMAKENYELKERVKRLEEAGDAMEKRLHLRKNISDQFVYKGDAESVENWNKAKEDKL